MKYDRIMLDESIFCFALERDQTYGNGSLKILERIEKGEIEQAYLSALSYAKIIGHYDNEEVARKILMLLSHFPNLTIAPFDFKAAEQTANVQRKYQLTFDQAVIVATAIMNNAQLIVTETKSIQIEVPGLEWFDVEYLKNLEGNLLVG